MTPREIASQAKFYQNYQYQELQLSQEQAEAVVRYTLDSQGLHDWEGLDFEYDSFKRILTPEQWPSYQVRYEEALAFYEQQLGEDDQRAAADLPRIQRGVRFYQEGFIPGIYQTPGLFPFIHLEPAKGDYLLAECRKYLQEGRKKAIRAHYQSYRRLGPHVLQSTLLRHELQALLPELEDFERAADEPTKAVLHHVLSQAGGYTHMRYGVELKALDAREAAFHRELFVARHGRPPEEVTGMRVVLPFDEKAYERSWT